MGSPKPPIAGGRQGSGSSKQDLNKVKDGLGAETTASTFEIALHGLITWAGDHAPSPKPSSDFMHCIHLLSFIYLAALPRDVCVVFLSFSFLPCSNESCHLQHEGGTASISHILPHVPT